MSYPIEQKLVIAVASSALFDLSESDRVFRERGEKVYRDYQQQHLNDPLDKGVAFPFVRRFLSINQRFAAESPVEVVLLSRNSAITGKRVFNSRSEEHTSELQSRPHLVCRLLLEKKKKKKKTSKKTR